MKNLHFKILLIIGLFHFSVKSFAHCEIPCGIYQDSLRIELIKEHIITIEKSMQKITELQNQDNSNTNQLVRWVMNKEKHAEKIQDIASQYFMYQRVKITNDRGQQRQNTRMLSNLHKLCVYAMKAKQTTDFGYIQKMNKALDEFSAVYFTNHPHKH